MTASENAKMNDLIRRATGHVVALDDSEDRGEDAPSIGGKADGGEGGDDRGVGAGDMNAELRRATGRPGFVDESGRAWS